MNSTNAMRFRLSMLGTVGCGALLATTPTAAFAQDVPATQDVVEDDGSNDAIIVTAQRRAERLTDVPITVTQVTGDTLDSAGVSATNSLSQVVPAFRLDYNGAFAQPTIRGVTTALANVGGGSSVGVYTDGFYNASPLSQDFELLNVSSIQVLKGPQGTLFGRNTTAGAVLITTTEPQQDVAAKFKFDYSSFNTSRAGFYLTGGLAEGLSADIGMLYRVTDGWFTNLGTGNDKVGHATDFMLRASVKMEFDDSGDNYVIARYSRMRKDDPTSLLWSVYQDPDGRFQSFSYAAQQAGIPGFENPIFGMRNGETAGDPGFSPEFYANVDSYQVSAYLDLGFATLTQHGQHRKESSFQDIEVDNSNIPIFQVQFHNEDRLWTYEALLNSKPGSRLSWVAGAFYMDQEAGQTDFTIVVPALGKMYETFINIKNWSVFADATYEVADGLFLTAGARYSNDKNEGQWTCLPDGVTNLVCPPTDTVDVTFNNFSPRGVIRYEFNPNTSVYASVSRGYKAGLANINGFSDVPIEPEELTAYEVGFKTASGRDRIELSGFYYDYTNLQVSTYNGTQSITTNAASSEVYGVEASFSKALFEGLTLSGGVAYTHGRYLDYPGAPANIFDYVFDGMDTAGNPNPGPAGGLTDGQADNRAVDVSGNHMIRSPDWSGNIALDYVADLGNVGFFKLNGNAAYSSKVFFDAANNNVQDAYTTVNLRAGWTDPGENLSISVYTNNLLDNDVIAQVLPNGFGTGVSWQPPRSYGVTLMYEY